MKTSDDRRREAAAKLRAEAERWRHYREDDNVFCMSDHEFTEGILEDFGFDDMDMPTYEVFDQMADLIDLTCELEDRAFWNGRYAYGFTCSRCLSRFGEEAAEQWNYCPNCGARVVRDED